LNHEKEVHHYILVRALKPEEGVVEYLRQRYEKWQGALCATATGGSGHFKAPTGL